MDNVLAMLEKESVAIGAIGVWIFEYQPPEGTGIVLLESRGSYDVYDFEVEDGRARFSRHFQADTGDETEMAVDLAQAKAQTEYHNRRA